MKITSQLSLTLGALTAVVVTFTTTLSTASAAQSADPWPLGSHCGLTDQYTGQFNDPQLKPIGQSIDLAIASPSQISSLSPTLQKTLVTCLREIAECNTATACVHQIADPLVGPDLQTYALNGIRYTVLTLMAGGNVVGWIMPENSVKPIADISDGDVICR